MQGIVEDIGSVLSGGGETRVCFPPERKCFPTISKQAIFLYNEKYLTVKNFVLIK